MATAYKVLGQTVLSTAAQSITLYTVPAATSAVCSTIVVCNQHLTDAATFHIAIRPAGAVINNKHYLAFATNINAKDSITITIGITLAATDVITVTASTTSVSFNLFGSEIS